MSSDEPVSAYSVFKAAKDMAGDKKNSKKKQNAQKKGFKVKGKKKGGPKKQSNVPTSLGVTKIAKKKNSSNKNNALKTKTTNNKTSEADVDDTQLTKTSQKKKKELQDFLVRQSKKNGNMFGEESFDSVYPEEGECSYADTIDEDQQTSAFSNGDEQSESNIENDTGTAETLADQAVLTKASKKRKNSDTIQTKSNNRALDNSRSIKKWKDFEETKPASSTSFSNAKAEKPCNRKSLDLGEDHLTQFKFTTFQTPNYKNLHKLNSIDEGKRTFEWLLNPTTAECFFSKYWEQEPCFIKRRKEGYFSKLISIEAIDRMLIKNHVEFTKNIDVTSYEKGIRKTLNPEGRALPPVVWDHYNRGCSIRLINPQTFLSNIFTMCTTMQEYFHCLVGANVYLTPPNSQGFAPHYDDIEAFVLQIEGRKRWKLYNPRTTSEQLPRYSSKNFKQNEIGEPILDTILEPGDVLYFPRGTIHQASTLPNYHSLHITVSVYQKQSFADLFEKMLPLMVQKAIASNLDLRRGLPRDAWHNAGIAFNNNTTEERAEFIRQVNHLTKKCIRELPLDSIIDSAMDQLAIKFQHEALPPEISAFEKKRTVFGSRNLVDEKGLCVSDYEIDERTNVRLLRANIIRLIDGEEEGNLRIYFYVDNSKEYCEYEPNFLEIEATQAASVELLIKSYPEYVGVSQLPLPSDDEKVNLATALWERGILMMEKPFK